MTHYRSPITKRRSSLSTRLVVNGWFWGQMHTGSGQYLHHLVAALPDVWPEGWHGTLVLPAAPVEPLPAGWQAVIAVPAPMPGRNAAKLWFEQVSFARACARWQANTAWIPYWAAPWQAPCPVAVTVHDLIPLLLPAYRGGLLPRSYTALAAATARRATLVLTDSAASRADIVAHLHIPAERVQAVPLAVDAAFCPVADAETLARVTSRYALPAAFLLYLGGFDVRKNLAGLLRGYALLPSDAPPLVIAGRLPAADSVFTPDPRRLAAEAGVAGRVHFTGWVDEADKPALYTLARLFVFPSFYEGYGLPVAEAAACGVPVVTSNLSSLPEAAPAAWLVDPADAAALAAAMQQALVAPRPRLPAAARTWHDVAAATLAALQTLL